MQSRPTRYLLTAALLFGAVVFGMVLAGALDLTPAGETAPVAQAEKQPVKIPTTSFGLPDFADLAEQVSPAVVSIEARTYETSARGRRQVDPFEFFFGPRRRPQPQPRDPDERDREFRSESGGSGFVISADGLVVTNYHVIESADELKVHMGNRTFDAEIKGSDPATDLALLKIEPGDEQLDYLELGDSDSLRVGEWVMAVGSPLGLADTVTVGVVSAKRRQINISADPSFENFIQTDAAINFGNSGGPLLNLAGTVVGINTAINWGSENIGFAVPVNNLKQILPQLRDEGRVSRGFLGIFVADLSVEAADAFGLEPGQGVLVTQVQENLPAAKAGLEHGDVVVKADGRPVADTRGLIDYVSSKTPGTQVNLEVIRNGEPQTIVVTLAERPNGDDEPAPAEADDEGGIEWLGLRYQDITSSGRSTHNIPENVDGVWITEVSARSPFRDVGLSTDQAINVITEVNGQAVDSVAQFERFVRDQEPGTRLRVYVRRFAGGTELQPVFVFPQVPAE